MPIKPAYEPSELVEYFKDVEDLTLVLYGGEPLVNQRFCMRLMDALPRAKFVLQSNCTLLYKLPTPYLLRLEAVLCSIDGVKSTFDFYRGSGTYESVLKNVADARSRGFSGPIVARGACSLRADIHRDVDHLTRLTDSEGRRIFDMCYWQLDSQWDDDIDNRWGDAVFDVITGARVDGEFDDEEALAAALADGTVERGFKAFIEHSYRPGIARLWDEWLADLEAGDIRNIVPFTGISRSVVFDQTPASQGGIWCGCGHRAFSICTDTRIQICPVGFDEANGTSGMWNFLGTIETTPPSRLAAKSPKLRSPCNAEECAVFEHCGGRCLFANQTQNWGPEGFDVVCSTVRQLVELAKRDTERIRAAVDALADDGKKSFFYRAEDISLEIVP